MEKIDQVIEALNRLEVRVTRMEARWLSQNKPAEPATDPTEITASEEPDDKVTW